MKLNLIFSYLSLTLVSWVALTGVGLLGKDAKANDALVFAGYNIAMAHLTSGGSDLSSGTANGFTFGGGYHYDLSNLVNLLGVELDVIYAPRGFSVSTPIAGISVTGNNTVNYLRFPLMVRYEVVPKIVRIGVGPYLGVAIGDVNQAGVVTTPRSSVNNWSSTDWGLTISGLGFFPLKESLDALLDIRYNFGFSDVFNVNGNPSAKLRDLSFMAGVRFAL